MNTITDTPVDNGINLPALLDARVALDDDPSLAQFLWRASCRWENGTHSYTTIEKFTGLGGEQSHRTEFGYDVDHPECFASEDHGPTPVEFVLVGLAGCLTAGIASVAQMRNIQLRSVTATLEADMDLTGRARHGPDRAQRLRLCRRPLPDRRRRHARRHRGARGAVAEAIGGLRHHRQPDQRRRRRQPLSTVRTAHRHRRGRTRRLGHEPPPHPTLDRPRRPRAR